MVGFSLTSRGFAAVVLAVTAPISVASTATGARAASAAQPGQTVGLPVGDQLPVGLYFVNLSSFGVRGTRPRDSATNVNLPTFAWATPWDVAGARLQFFFTQPIAAASSQGAPYQSGVGQQLLAGQALGQHGLARAADRTQANTSARGLQELPALGPEPI